MIHLNIVLTVNNASDTDRVRELLSEQGRLSREEPGCARFEVYQSTADDKVFFLNEWWESQEAIDAHRLAKAYTTVYKPNVLPLVERVGHPSVMVK